MEKKVRIGFIGTGFARTVQIPAFQSIAGAEIVSIASGRRENAEKAARDFNIPHFTDNWRETVERDDVDLICITTPPVYHREMTLFALEHDKHVLCEKPTAMSAAEAKEMWEKALEKPHLLCLIDHELRFLNGRRRAFEMIRAVEIGKIIHAKYNFRAPHRGDPNLPWTWWSEKERARRGSGAIGSHAVRHFALDHRRRKSSSVFCQLQRHVKERCDEKSGRNARVTTDDETNMLLRFAAANLSKMQRQRVAFNGRISGLSKSRRDFRHYGRDARRIRRRAFRRKKGVGKLGKTRHRIKPSRSKASKIRLEQRLSGIRRTDYQSACKTAKQQSKTPPTFEDGYNNQLLLDAARESSEKGCAVNLDFYSNGLGK
jgi:predicted dehydrogenase